MSAVKVKPKKPIPKTTPKKPLTKPQVIPSTNEKEQTALDDCQTQLGLLKELVFEHNRQITDLQETLARKRKRVPNGKVRIRDKETNKVYPSKNNAYQSLLKEGELKDLVEKGVFGDLPEKNTFGWYALKRELPDRFEELPEDHTEESESAEAKADSED